MPGEGSEGAARRAARAGRCPQRYPNAAPSPAPLLLRPGRGLRWPEPPHTGAGQGWPWGRGPSRHPSCRPPPRGLRASCAVNSVLPPLPPGRPRIWERAGV